jgi:tRNA 2-thiouridine synthesizing protein E
LYTLPEGVESISIVSIGSPIRLQEGAMADIMKFILNDTANYSDPQGHLLGLEEWNRDVAEKYAREAGLALTAEHWEVIGFLRTYYKEHGPVEHARELVHALNERFAAQGGSQHLYQLFPGGPVRQASRIAGLPAPPGVVDPSFGTSQ